MHPHEFDVDIGKVLGAGEFGEVFKGVRLKDKTVLAIKILKGSQPNDLKLFFDEVRVCCKVGDHPNVLGLTGIYNPPVEIASIYGRCMLRVE